MISLRRDSMERSTSPSIFDNNRVKIEFNIVLIFSVHLMKHKIMSEKSKEYARFDARLSKEQKSFFEKAAAYGGYRSLTDFVILTVQSKAKEIVQEKEQILASEKDAEIFFNAINKTKKPSKTLKNALKDYEAFESQFLK